MTNYCVTLQKEEWLGTNERQERLQMLDDLYENNNSSGEDSRRQKSVERKH